MGWVKFLSLTSSTVTRPFFIANLQSIRALVPVLVPYCMRHPGYSRFHVTRWLPSRKEKSGRETLDLSAGAVAERVPAWETLFLS